MNFNYQHQIRGKKKPSTIGCQICQLPMLSTGEVISNRLPLIIRIKLLISHQKRQSIKQRYKKAEHAFRKFFRLQKPSIPPVPFPILNLKAGERVRVRSWDEIALTLDKRGDFKGCGFMLGMKKYIGTEQTVFKPVKIFVDERDLRLKEAKGLVLLEGLICEGDERYEHCDRACFYFWREEWLERV